MTASARARSALTLVETVVAIFLFVGGSLACFQLALSAVRHSARVSEVTQATLIAESALDRVREWAYRPDNYLSAWAIYNDQTFNWPDPEGYRVRTRIAADQRSPLSPCTTLSVGYPLRQLVNSTRLVTVDVSWRDGGPANRVSLNGLIGEPARPVLGGTPVVVTRTGALDDPLPLDAITRYRAELRDSNNIPIQGVLWSWLLEQDPSSPTPGMATVIPLDSSPLGEEIELIHRFYQGDPSTSTIFDHVPGGVILKVTCYYDGGNYEAAASPLELAEP